MLQATVVYLLYNFKQDVIEESSVQKLQSLKNIESQIFVAVVSVPIEQWLVINTQGHLNPYSALVV